MPLAIDTIFFDVDGTLVDAKKDISVAMNRALREMGLPEKPHEEIISYVGSGVGRLIAKSTGSDDPAMVERGIRLYTEHYLKHPADHAALYPHVRETLEYFARKTKYVLTNRYRSFTVPLLESLGMAHYFAGVIGGDNETCVKPSPRIFDCPVTKPVFDRERSLIVGDMDVDIQVGKNAGIRTCWVTYGLGRREDVEKLKPDFIIGDIAELRGIIKR